MATASGCGGSEIALTMADGQVPLGHPLNRAHDLPVQQTAVPQMLPAGEAARTSVVQTFPFGASGFAAEQRNILSPTRTPRARRPSRDRANQQLTDASLPCAWSPSCPDNQTSPGQATTSSAASPEMSVAAAAAAAIGGARLLGDGGGMQRNDQTANPRPPLSVRSNCLQTPRCQSASSSAPGPLSVQTSVDGRARAQSPLRAGTTNVPVYRGSATGNSTPSSAHGCRPSPVAPPRLHTSGGRIGAQVNRCGGWDVKPLLPDTSGASTSAATHSTVLVDVSGASTPAYREEVGARSPSDPIGLAPSSPGTASSNAGSSVRFASQAPAPAFMQMPARMAHQVGFAPCSPRLLLLSPRSNGARQQALPREVLPPPLSTTSPDRPMLSDMPVPQTPDRMRSGSALGVQVGRSAALPPQVPVSPFQAVAGVQRTSSPVRPVIHRAVSPVRPARPSSPVRAVLRAASPRPRASRLELAWAEGPLLSLGVAGGRHAPEQEQPVPRYAQPQPQPQPQLQPQPQRQPQAQAQPQLQPQPQPMRQQQAQQEVTQKQPQQLMRAARSQSVQHRLPASAGVNEPTGMLQRPRDLSPRVRDRAVYEPSGSTASVQASNVSTETIAGDGTLGVESRRPRVGPTADTELPNTKDMRRWFIQKGEKKISI